MSVRRSGGAHGARAAGPLTVVTALLTAYAAAPPLARAQAPRTRPPARVTPASAAILADTLAPARLLVRLQGAALAASPALTAAHAELEAARARAGAAGFAPPLALSAGVSEAPNGNLGQGNLRLEVGRDLFTGPRRRAERAVADADVRAAEAGLAAAERGVRAAVLREAVRAAGARLVAGRLAAEDALLAGGEDGVRARFAVGEARYVDVLRLRTERLRVQGERAAALAEARAAVAALGGLLGPTPAHPGVPPGVPPLGAPPVAAPLLGARQIGAALDTLAAAGLAESWRRVLPAVRGRRATRSVAASGPAVPAEVASAEATAAAVDSLANAFAPIAGDVQRAAAAPARAAAERTLAAALRRPQTSAFAGVQRIGQANTGPTFGPSLGVTISLPFTAARANHLGAAAGDRAVAAAEASRAAVTATATARVRAAAERYLAARERLAAFDAALLRGARDEREAALAAYRTGGLTLLELVDFERALARAEIDRVRALVAAADALADLSTGGAGDGAASLLESLTAPGLTPLGATADGR